MTRRANIFMEEERRRQREALVEHNRVAVQERMSAMRALEVEHERKLLILREERDRVRQEHQRNGDQMRAELERNMAVNMLEQAGLDFPGLAVIPLSSQGRVLDLEQEEKSLLEEMKAIESELAEISREIALLEVPDNNYNMKQ